VPDNAHFDTTEVRALALLLVLVLLLLTYSAVYVSVASCAGQLLQHAAAWLLGAQQHAL
jgi:hypothetical protein